MIIVGIDSFQIFSHSSIKANMKNTVVLLFFTTFALFTATSNAQPQYAITKVEQSGDLIIIYYYHTPIGDQEDAEYEVSLRLTRESDKNFNVAMTDAKGDIGDGKFVGTNRRILWAHKKQFPKGLPFDDIEFELTIEKNEGIPSWVWYTGGAAVVGVGAVLLLSKPKEEETTVGALPGPPTSRPN
jgi:hypothetical protein